MRGASAGTGSNGECPPSFAPRYRYRGSPRAASAPSGELVYSPASGDVMADSELAGAGGWPSAEAARELDAALGAHSAEYSGSLSGDPFHGSHGSLSAARERRAVSQGWCVAAAAAAQTEEDRPHPRRNVHGIKHGGDRWGAQARRRWGDWDREAEAAEGRWMEAGWF